MCAKIGPRWNSKRRDVSPGWPHSTIRLVPEHVGGHQVGRELDARERQLQRLGQRAHQQRLAQAGDAFQQHVPAREQRGGDRARDVGLPDHAAGDLDQQPVDVRAERGDGGGRHVVGCHAIGGRRHLCAFPVRPVRGRIRSK